MLPAEWRGLSRLLAVRMDNLGDVVLLGPALRSLHYALPRASITLLCSPHGAQIAPLLPWVDEVIEHRASWQELTTAGSARSAGSPRQITPQDALARELALVERLAAGAFDAAIIFTSFTQSPWPPAYVCQLAGIPLRLGQSREFGGQLLTHWLRPPADDGHQVDRNLHLLQGAGFPPAGQHLELLIPDPVAARAEALLRTAGVDPEQPYIVLAPGASAATRRYPAARFAQLLRLLRRDCALPVVLLGSPKEETLCHELMAEAGGSPGLISLAGRSSVPDMAAVIARAALVIANNSGPLHIGDAFGRPLLILYSGSELESQWAPRRSAARLLRRSTACSPCHAFSCPHDMECLDIAPEQAAEAALELLGAQAAVPPAAGPRKENPLYASP